VKVIVSSTSIGSAPVRLGLGPNLAQFSLLVLVNAFVGAMVGLERSILPAIAEQDFHLPDVNYVSPLTTTRLPHRLSLPTLHSR
jgi:hypothetical protein